MVEAFEEERIERSSHDASSFLEFTGDIHPNTEIPNGAEILIYSKAQSYLTHGIHKFPAKFFPELPRFLIARYSNSGDSVLDPMCGSGTVVLEAQLKERVAIGIDIDPMARLISKAKTKPISPEILTSVKEWLLTTIDVLHSDSASSPRIPEFNYRDSWFRDFVQYELGIIRDAIDKFSGSSLAATLTSACVTDITRFLYVVFSSIIRDVSNADPHCTRTVIRQKLQREIAPGETVTKFGETLEKQLAGMSELYQVSLSKNLREPIFPDSNAISTGLDSESIDLAVTSPPYINAVDYPRTHQLEMYWLGLVEDGPLSNMKRRYIGTETVYKREYESLRVSGLKTLDPLLKRIYQVDPRRSYITYKFFEDMKLQLQETKRVLRPGGYYCVAIGNNVIRKVPIHSHLILSELATSKDVGFELVKTFFSGLIRHFIRIPRKERMSGEWILVLRKSGN
ncbi:MAG: DNA methyltransferase [Promethearchaeota archaeon]